MNPPQVFKDCIAAAKLLQSCPTLCDPIDGSPPGFPVPGILQARTLELVSLEKCKLCANFKKNYNNKTIKKIDF